MSTPLSIIIVGASGDLTSRKLVPALYGLYRKGRLPAEARIVGVSRSDFTADSFRQHLAKEFREIAPKEFDSAKWEKFAPLIEYVRGDAADPTKLQALVDWLKKREGGQPANRLYYLSVAPELYERIANSLAAVGLNKEDGGFRRVVIEKPFGRNLATAVALNHALHRNWEESQIYRIDHYMGKETVQNILVLRFANLFFEPLWNRRYIDHVQITVAEKLDVGRRGPTYESIGVLRDIFQNHLLQILTLVAMEPATRFDAVSLRNEKLKVLEAVAVPNVQEACINVSVGQYIGYRQTDGVARDSHIPTFAAIRLDIDNWRWQGVPFYLRSGKALKERRSDVVIQFRPPPHLMFKLTPGEMLANNRLVLRIQPDEGIQLHFESKDPEVPEGMLLHNSTMQFSFATEYGAGAIPEAYERLLLDAVNGDATLFMRYDEIERAWAILDPLIAAVEQADAAPPQQYEPHTWGPACADEMLKRDGREWQND
ncbi:MAG TPA: glucose-6-phosphate dehydrogenase [Gemmataceae bacterium]|nr:glucose-6-phosphate dehydrogenase [Gemmataceae bacterium]